MVSALCLLASAAILFYILKFRVHIHVHISKESSGLRQSVRPARSAKVPAVRRSAGRSDEGLRNIGSLRDISSATATGKDESQQAATRDIESALRNLGALPAAARIAAARASKESPQDFGQALKLTIQYATQKEAA